MPLQTGHFSTRACPIHHGRNRKSMTADFAHKSKPGLEKTAETACVFPGQSGAFSGISPAKVQPALHSRGNVAPMGTILTRKRKDGTKGFTALIRIKRGGVIIHGESKTFDRKQAASAWLERREGELAKPGGLERKDDPALGAVIDRYIADSHREIGRTKAQVLRTIKGYDIAEMRCSEIKSADYVAFANALPVSPQTRQNYLSHLRAVVMVARPAWSYPLDEQEIKDAMVALKRLGATAKSGKRDRRPTIAELDQIMDHFGTVKKRRPGSAPMQKIILFAIFSTRRQDEITRIAWSDYDKTRVMVRDMKHPGDKAGNDQWCELPPEAAAIIDTMPQRGPVIFPYSTDAISAAFTRACHALGIEDLHFHDLRHDGVSRLFEMERTIPQVASVSGHRSWQSLKRYTHLRQTGDKYEGWKWNPLKSE